MNPVKMILEHKPSFKFCRAKVEKIIRLAERDFETFLQNPMGDRDFVKENIGLMHMDENGIYHCLLVTGEGRADGLLVESEGSGCARYASYVLDAAALRYPTLSRLNRELAEAVDAIIAEGVSRTAAGNWTVSFEELEDMTGLCVEGKPFLQETLGDMLCSRPEVADLTIEDGQFDVAYHLDFCPNCRKETAQEELPDKAGRQEMKSSSQENVPAGTPGMIPSM